MAQLLVKYRTKINWTNYKDWSYTDNDTWTFDDGIAYHNASTGSLNILSKELLRKKTKYRISFELVDPLTGTLTDGVYIVCDSYISTSLTGLGKKSITLQAWSSTLQIVPINSYANFGIKNFSIEEIAYEELDVFEYQILLNKSISDVKNLEERSGSYTKEIILPGTPKNNQFFKYIFELTEDNNFNINAKCPAALSKDSKIIEEGYIQLNEILIDADEIRYEVVFYSNVIDLFKDIGDKKLNELDLSGFDHTCTIFNAITSWVDDSIPYYYPYIQYGGKNHLSLWGGVVGAGTDTTGKGITMADIYPAMKVKPLIDHIFSANNYTYESTLLNSTEFSKLILPYTNPQEKLSGWHVIAENFAGNEQMNRDDAVLGPWIAGIQYFWNRSKHTASYTTGLFKTGVPIQAQFKGGPFNSTSKTIDTYGKFNATSSVYNDYTYVPLYTFNPNTPQSHQSIHGGYRCFRDGKYKITAKFGIVQYSNISGIEGNYYYKIFAYKVKAENVTFVGAPADYFIIENNSGEEAIEIGEYKFNSGVHEISAELDCKEDDIIGFKIMAKPDQHEVAVNTELYYKVAIYNLKVYEWLYGELSSIEMKNVVPENLKIKDFLKSIFLMYNIYIEQDKLNPRNYLIETRDVFYTGGTTHDWSQKIDNIHSYKSIKEFQNKIIKLSYANGTDYYNELYNENRDPDGVRYGGKAYELDSEFLEDSTSIELSFAPTIMRTNYDYTLSGNMFTTFSEITKEEREELETKTEPRILLYNYLNANAYNTAQTYNFRVAGFSLSGYPYAGHIYNPNEMTSSSNFDINFETKLKKDGISKLYFSPNPINTITNNNLYNNYWANYFNLINNKDARILTADFNLNADDINNLSMRDLILVNNVYYYINNIEDFNLDGGTLTTVELVTAINATHSFSSITTDSTIIQPPEYGALPSTVTKTTGNGIINSSGITATQNITAIGSTNVTFTSGGTNAIVIGVNGKLVSDDSIYIGGLKITSAGDVLIDGDMLLDPGADCVQVIFSEAELNDSGENVIWAADWIDANVLIDPEHKNII